MSPALQIALIASLTALACALVGSLLVLRRMALMSDAISHAILPGIVLGVLLGGSLGSPWALVGAVLAGMLLVRLVGLLVNTRRMHADAAIGLVFPVMFSAGVILVARQAGQIHLDTDAVLLGELAFAPLDRLVLGGRDLGPRGLWLSGAVLLPALLLVLLCYKELKLAAFDPDLAAAQGLRPALLDRLLLGLTSLVCVAAFDVVGSVLVVALMIAPAAAAWLLVNRMGSLLAVACGLGVGSVLAGYGLARGLDLSLAGSMAVCCTVMFLGVFLLAPGRGILALRGQRQRNRRRFAVDLLLVHLLQHEGGAREAEEARLDHLSGHFGWSPGLARHTVEQGGAAGLLRVDHQAIRLTDQGRRRAAEVMLRD
jgi:manganese/zinc/iron transport system permease protein